MNLIPKNLARLEASPRDGAPTRLVPRKSRSGAVIPEAQPVVGVLRRDALYRRSLALADVLSAAIAAVVGLTVFEAGASLRPAAILALPGVALVSKAIGLYDRDEHLLHKTTIDEIPALFQVATLYALVTWLCEKIFVNGALGKPQVAAMWALLFVLMTVSRAAARWFARREAETERCLVIGDADSADRIRRKLEAANAVKAEVVGRVPLADERDDDDDPSRLGSMDMLGLTLVEHDIHRAIIAPSEADMDDVLEAIRLVKSLGVKVSVLPRLFEVVGSSVEVDDVEGIVLLGVRRFGLTHSSRVLKRALDVVGSTCALVLLAPLFAWVALLIKLTSPGPVFFRQPRIGESGREFVMLKFRTMFDGADALKQQLLDLNETEGIFKIADDPRITRVGRFLRQTSLDELPQLFNVLRGDMSLVGPRPLIPQEDRQVEGWRRRRLHIPPGMTGLWQIFGSSRIPLQEMVKIDYLYGANWSLWLDVKILMRTIPYTIARRGL